MPATTTARTTDSTTHHEEDLAMHPNDTAVACQHIRTTSRQHRTRGRRAARDDHLRPPLADTAGGALDNFSLALSLALAAYPLRLRSRNLGEPLPLLDLERIRATPRK
jgi:hypothetical protein